MLNNWFKKEKPFAGFAGFGGGATGLAFGSASEKQYATGGIVNDYEEGGTYYRAHIFVSPGTFDVIEDVTSVDWLVVAGGGAGGGSVYCGGGGGAGGYRTGTSHSVSIQPYPIVVGKGGRGSGHENKSGCKGQNSSAFGFSSTGGGAGGPHNGPQPGDAGGSGGGGSQGAGNDGTGNQGNYTPAEGYPGSGNWYAAGGGGGGAGGPHPNPSGGGNGPYNGGTSATRGRDGVRNTLAGPSAEPSPVGAPGPGSGPSATGWFAGGAGGGQRSDYGCPQGDGGYGGGGQGGAQGGGFGRTGFPGFITSGGGGGGVGGTNNTVGYGGDGGQGIVVVRYELPEIKTKSATGGNISFYQGKTIHTFVTNGTFTAPSSFSKSVEYVVIGGGGGGGGDRAGGGGAGAVVTGTRTCNGPFASTVTIGLGGQGGYVNAHAGVSGSNGGTTSINIPGGTVSAPGGGGGGGSNTNSGHGNGIDGASGGGTSRSNYVSGLSPAPDRGQATHPSGNPGGSAYNGTDPNDGGGGGGGTGGIGGNAPSGGVGGDGGEGSQLPATFQDPNSGVGFPGPAGGFYVAGGGGGGAWGPGPGPGGAGKAGGGDGGILSSPQHSSGHSAYDGSGSGGGGSGGYPADRSRGGMGGSGMILIAYPT